MLKDDVACLNVRVLSDITVEQLRTTMEIFNEDGRSWRRHFNLEPLRTRSRDSVVGIATGYGLKTEGSEFESR
jgi:hypothetical protein